MSEPADPRCAPQSQVTPRVAILAAMRRELASLEAQTRISRIRRTSSFRAVEGHLDRSAVVLASTGEGADNARRGAASLFEQFSFDWVVIVGAAGALSPSLEPGVVLAITEVLDRGERVPAPDPGLLRSLIEATGAMPATLCTTRRIIGTARGKAEAAASLPAGTVAVVDLETAAFARAAGSRGLPYVAIRAVCDTATETLPVDFNVLRDSSGALDTKRIALTALLRPWLLAPFWGLRSRIRVCSDNLAFAVRATLAYPPIPRVQGLG